MELSQANLVVCHLKQGQLAHKVALISKKQTNKQKQVAAWRKVSHFTSVVFN